MNAQVQRVNRHRYPQRVINAIQAAAPVTTLTDEDVLKMAEWYAELEYGRYAVESDSLDKTIN